MACCRPHDAGYATPLALVVSLALALVAVGMVARSTMMLRQARADLARSQAEHALDGAQLEAAATVIRAGAGSAFRWALSTDLGWTEALAESEAEKLDFAAAAALPETTLARFGVADAAALKARLAAAAEAAPDVDVVDLDASPLWRACGPSLVSPFGARSVFARPAYAEPSVGREDPAWRVGEVWRVRITSAEGWRDERFVRFTGDARRPVAVVARRLTRTDGGERSCDAVLAAA